MRALFTDRVDAGRRLGRTLGELAKGDVIVLGLPRGGVPVAAEVARALAAPLDIIVVRKLGAPFQPELAMGAVGENGVRVLNDDVLALARIGAAELGHVEARERAEVERRARELRGGLQPVPLTDRTVIIVDDGIATGATARAAIEVAREHGAGRVVLAVPVAPNDTVAHMRKLADDVVCLASPEPFMAVGPWYTNFRPTSDAEVVDLLHEARRAELARAADGQPRR